MNRDSNILKAAFEVIFFYNINCRLNVLVDGSWSIGDFEFKVFKDGSEKLYHFSGQLYWADPGVC